MENFDREVHNVFPDMRHKVFCHFGTNREYYPAEVVLVLMKISMSMLIMEEINIMGTTPLVDFHPFSFCSHTHFLGFFPSAVFLVLCNCVSPSFIFLTYHLIPFFFFFPCLAFSSLLFALQDLCCHILWKCLNALQHRLLYILGLQDHGQFNVSASSRYKVTRV